jgi:hypothetical protein
MILKSVYKLVRGLFSNAFESDHQLKFLLSYGFLKFSFGVFSFLKMFLEVVCKLVGSLFYNFLGIYYPRL